MRRDAGGSLSLWLERLFAFLFEDDIAFTRAALAAYLGPDKGIDPEEESMLMGWAAWGRVEPRGERGVDRFIRFIESRQGPPSEAERKWLEALREVWISLFRISAVRREVGLELEDLLTGKRLFVSEHAGTLEAKEGQVLVAWIASLPDHHQLAGPVYPIPEETAPAARRVLAPTLGPPAGVALSPEERGRVTSRIPDLFRCVRIAARACLPEALRGGSPEPVAFCEAIYEVRDAEAVASRMSAAPGVIEDEPGRRFRWLRAGPGGSGGAEGEPEAAAWIEIRFVRLSLRAAIPGDLEEAKRFLGGLLAGAVEHRFDRLKDALEGVDRILPGPALELDGPGRGPPPREDEAIEAFDRAVGKRIRGALFPAGGALAPEPGRPAASGAGRERPPSPRPEGTHHSLPPLGHEAVCLRLPGLRGVAREVCDRVRRSDVAIQEVLAPEELMRQPAVEKFLSGHLRTLATQGCTNLDLLIEQGIVGNHLFCLVNHELQGRKTFWVDESLAWMLSETELDIAGSCLRLPFPAFALVLTD
ncbi:MAG: hypothetical protein HY721_19370 [Planctomycetes bacterium]|nr:hypothetical protein [Planctomycetota bacterium]